MASNFPSSLDTFTNPSSTDAMDSVSVPHATQHSDLNDAVEALQAKVGADSSGVASSHDYKIAQLEAAADDIAIFNESQASGTAGGTATAGSYVKRTLNNTVVNNISGASIASSVITLPAGTYKVEASAPAHRVNGHKLRLQDTTNTTTLAVGNNAYEGSVDDSQTSAILSTLITLAGATDIELQHRVGTTKTTNGLGILCSFGDDEVYAQITIRKVA